MEELARLDAVAQAEACARGEVSASELWSACLARIERLNPVLRAVVTLSSERPRAASKKPFSGVPFLVKDVLPWPGLRWSMASRLFATNVASQHTPFGDRLVEAGLVCAGKSAMSELGLLASTESLLEGVTHNPWDLALSAGGSSGGSAAAVAAGLVPLAHANDGGGSIRVPAAACGVFGFKPSRGRTVSASFVTNDFLEMTSDHCVSRSVRDSALFLAQTEDLSYGTPVGYVREPLSRKLRIATWTRTMMGGEPDAAVLRAWEDTVTLLAELGHGVEVIAAPEYEPALADAFYLVAGAAVAGVVESMDLRRGTPVQLDELEPFSWALYERHRARGPEASSFARAQFSRAVRAYRETTHGYDVVLTPTLATTPHRLGLLSPLLGHDEILRRTARVNGYAPVHNLAGAPAMSVPLQHDGAPIGMHFAAAVGADALLLSLAYQLERARPWRDRWPPLSIPALARAYAQQG